MAVEILGDPFLKCVIANNEGFKTSSFVKSIQKIWTKPNKKMQAQRTPSKMARESEVSKAK